MTTPLDKEFEPGEWPQDFWALYDCWEGELEEPEDPLPDPVEEF